MDNRRFLFVVSLALITLTSADESTPQSAPSAAMPGKHAAHMASRHFHALIRREGAMAEFSVTEGCLRTQTRLDAFQTKDGVSFGFVEVIKDNPCTFEFLQSIAGEGRVTFQVGKNLADAHLQGVIPSTDEFSGDEFQVVIDVTWTAEGDPVFESLSEVHHGPGLLRRVSRKGTSREALSSGGTVMLASDSENIIEGVDGRGMIFNTKRGFFEISRTN
jgi:hypothetical protein